MLRRLIQLSIFSIILTSFAISASAQAATPTPTPAAADDDEPIRVESKLVVVPVSVTNPATGEPVAGLGINDFRLLEEGSSQKIESVSPADNVPLEIALLFDVSASTDAMFKFEMETAGHFLRNVLRPEDRAVIFSVGENPRLIHPRGTADESIAAISTLAPTKEMTAFYDSVRMAANYLSTNTPPGRRKVLLIISDGEDTNSVAISRAMLEAEQKVTSNVMGNELKALRVKARDSAKKAEQTKVLSGLQNADTVFYSINPAGSSYQLNQVSIFGQENMQIFAGDTGGYAFVPKLQPIDTKDDLANSSNLRKNKAMLEQIFKQISSELRSQYLLQYYPETSYPDGKFVTLKVTAPSRAGATVRARQGYYVKN